MFEIKGVSADVIAAFSTRSVEIEAALGERGTSREAASAAEKQVAALDTRQAKVAADQASLVAHWRKTADPARFDPRTRLAPVREATANAAHATGGAAHAMAAKREVAPAAHTHGERHSDISVVAFHAAPGPDGVGKGQK